MDDATIFINDECDNATTEKKTDSRDLNNISKSNELVTTTNSLKTSEGEVLLENKEQKEVCTINFDAANAGENSETSGDILISSCSSIPMEQSSESNVSTNNTSENQIIANLSHNENTCIETSDRVAINPDGVEKESSEAPVLGSVNTGDVLMSNEEQEERQDYENGQAGSTGQGETVPPQSADMMMVDLSIVKTEVIDDDEENNNANSSGVKSKPFGSIDNLPSFAFPHGNEQIPENSSSLGDQQDTDFPPSVKVEIKQEPIDPEWGHVHIVQQYRNYGPIVVYSDSSSEDGDASDEEKKDGGDADESSSDDSNSENEEQSSSTKKSKEKWKKTCQTVGEVFPEDLPQIEYLTVAPDEEVELQPLGKITGIVDILVVIKANLFTPALYDDTVLFKESREPIGLVFETFGTVEQTYYSIRFNDVEDIHAKVKIGDVVYYAPKADNLTKYVFLKELQSMKYDDASWRDDNPPPNHVIEFSDDEDEKRAKRKNRNRKRQDGQEGTEKKSEPQKPRNNKYDDSWNPHGPLSGNNQKQTGDGPKLLRGDLNKNPFGDDYRSFNPRHGTRYPPRGPPRPPLFQGPPPPPWQGPRPPSQQQHWEGPPPQHPSGGPPPSPHFQEGPPPRYPSGGPPPSPQFQEGPPPHPNPPRGPPPSPQPHGGPPPPPIGPPSHWEGPPPGPRGPPPPPPSPSGLPPRPMFAGPPQWQGPAGFGPPPLRPPPSPRPYFDPHGPGPRFEPNGSPRPPPYMFDQGPPQY